MNLERLEGLAQWLEGGAKHEHVVFDMSTGLALKATEDYDPENPSHNSCETSCCIAGATVQFYADEDDKPELEFPMDAGETGEEANFWDNVFPMAQELLGLEHQQASRLFYPSGELQTYNDPAWAARTIRHLMATGEVDWKATDTDGKLRHYYDYD